MCWDVNRGTKNLYLHGCHGEINQNFYFVPEEGRSSIARNV